jgi:hypothetical protein
MLQKPLTLQENYAILNKEQERFSAASAAVSLQ